MAKIRTFPLAVALAALAVALAVVPFANAQRIPIDTTPSPDELRSIFTFQVENDYFNLIGKSDRDYTNGLRLGWLSPALPDLPDGLTSLTTIPTFFGEDPVSSVTRRLGISIGQNLYTPQNTDTSAPIYNDRPYAAWLYMAFGPAIDLQAGRSANDAGRAGAARHPAARCWPGRAGGWRRVRAEQLPSLYRRYHGQRLGQPAAQRADARPHLRAALAYQPRRGV